VSIRPGLLNGLHRPSNDWQQILVADQRDDRTIFTVKKLEISKRHAALRGVRVSRMSEQRIKL
jgi:hypothetical protein